MMRLPKKIFKSILVAFYVVSAIMLFYFSAWNASRLIQYPPARGDLILVGGLASSSALSILLVSMVKRITKTKFGKETYCFVFIVIMSSLLIHLSANLILKMQISHESIIVLSVIVSTPLSLVFAGYSKKTLKNRLKKLGLNRGITLVSIFILVSIPIIEWRPQFIFHLPQTVYVLPNLKFQSTKNTTRVNGQINISGFFAEVPIYENETFEAKQIVELGVTNWGNESIDLHFYVTGFMGNFEFLKDLELGVASSSTRVSIVYMEKGVILCNQTEVLLEPYDTLLLDIECSGVSPLTFNTASALSISVFHHGTRLQNINISLKTVEW